MSAFHAGKQSKFTNKIVKVKTVLPKCAQLNGVRLRIAHSLRAPTFEMAVRAANTGYIASGRTYARALWRNSVRKLSLFNGTEEIWLIDNVRAVLQVNRSEPISTVDKRRNNGGLPWRRHNVPAAEVFFTEYTFR